MEYLYVFRNPDRGIPNSWVTIKKWQIQWWVSVNLEVIIK